MSNLKQKYDASTVAVMRQALNEVVKDRRFLARKSVTTLQVAEHILQQAAAGGTLFRSCAMAMTSCAGANGFASIMLFGTPFDAHSSACAPLI